MPEEWESRGRYFAGGHRFRLENRFRNSGPRPRRSSGNPGFGRRSSLCLPRLESFLEAPQVALQFGVFVFEKPVRTEQHLDFCRVPPGPEERDKRNEEQRSEDQYHKQKVKEQNFHCLLRLRPSRAFYPDDRRGR